MPIFTPTHKVTISGIEYTSEILSGATITAGRVDIFDETQPSYCNLELMNLSGTSPTINLLDPIVIETKNTAGTFVKLFTGEVSSVSNTLSGAGAGGTFANVLQIQAQGALSQLVKRFAGTVSYPIELDGARITRILQETLYTAWEDLSTTLTWNDLPVADTWANYGVQGIDTIDTGRYTVLARSSAEGAENAFDLVNTTSASGLGYMYETTAGNIGYADAERRTANYGSNLIPLDSLVVSTEGIQTRLQTSDIVNSVVVQYGDPRAEVEAIDDASVNLYGLLQQVNSTILSDATQATNQATRFVALRGIPKTGFDSLSLDLANGNLDNTTRDSLLGVTMDKALFVTALPVGLFPTTEFEGYVEGWTWTLGKNTLDLQMLVSNKIYSTVEVQWEDYNPTTQWQNLDNVLTWNDLAIG
jgi:hypothetical protein